MESLSRNRKKTQRFGKQLSNLDFSFEEEEEAVDQHSDDETYHPSTDDESYQPPKRKRNGDERREEENIRQNISGDPIELSNQNFDNEFDKISNSISEKHTESISDHNLNVVNGCNCSEHEKMLKSMHENTVTILKRISVIEDTLIKNGTLSTIRGEGFEADPFEHFHSFCTQNGLPLKNLDDMNIFENKLADEKFKSETVCR